MLRRTSLLSCGLLVCVLALAVGSARAADEPTLESVVAQIVKAQGGEKLKTIKSIKTSGKLVFGGGQAEGTLVGFVARPGKIRQEISLSGARLVQAYDGTTAWQINPFAGSSKPEKMSEDEAGDLMDSADMDGPFVDSAKKGYKLELAADEELDGTPVHVVKVTNKRGKVETYYVDAASGLILKVRGKEKIQGNEVEVETLLSNYKEVNGIMTAHAVDRLIGGQPFIQIVLDRVEHNVEVEDGLFKMPEE
jgi:outer membrane lipoprotein-sorting protein